MPSFLFLHPSSLCLHISPHLSISARHLELAKRHPRNRPLFLLNPCGSDGRQWRRAGRFHPDKDHMVQSPALRRRRAVLAHPPRQADTKDKRWRMSPTLIRISCFYPLVPWKAFKSTRLRPEAGPNICIFGPIPTPSRSNCLSLGEERAPMQKTADACMKGGADKRGSEGRREGKKEEKTF